MPDAPPSTSFSHSTGRTDSSPNFVSRLASMGRAAVGRVLSMSHRQAISDGHKGVPLSAEHCQAISDGMKGVPLSAEHRQALSDAKMGNTNNSKPVDPQREAGRVPLPVRVRQLLLVR